MSELIDSIYDVSKIQAEADRIKEILEATKKLIGETRGAKDTVALSDASKKLNDNMVQGKKAVEEYTAVEKELIRQKKELETVEAKRDATSSKNSQEIQANKKLLAEQNELLKAQSILNDKNSGTIEKLTASNKILALEKKKLNLETAEGAERLKEIIALEDKNNKALAEGKNADQKRTASIGEYKKQMNELFQSFTLGEIGTKQLASGFAKLGKQMIISFVTNPIFLAIGALVLLIKGVTQAFKESEDRSNKLSEGFARLKPIIRTIGDAFEVVADIVIKYVYGLESSIEMAIYKLNATATDYVLKSTFAIDFDTYSKQNFYSEFSLKSISCIDQYNQTKSTAKNFTGVLQSTIPTTQYYINFVSLKRVYASAIRDEGATPDNNAYLVFAENEDSKWYNSDFALFSQNETVDVYNFSRDASGTTMATFSVSGRIGIPVTGIRDNDIITVKVYRNDLTDPILTLTGTQSPESTGYSFKFDSKVYEIEDLAFADGDFWFVGVNVSGAGAVITDILGDFSLDLHVTTEVDANQYKRNFHYLTAETLFGAIFDDQATIEEALKPIGITSAPTIVRQLDYVSLIPKDFITDFCIANGAMVNFKNDGTVEIAKISTYFEALLDQANAVEVTMFKDLEISYDTSLNFASVSVGMEQKKYDVFTYHNDWQKILTFNQPTREASENLNLTLTKFRTDYSGILDFVTKMLSTDKSTDLFLFNPAFDARSSSEGWIYDLCVPRDILTNWRTFLEFIFFNFGKDNLVISSNGGDDFNLELEPGYNQFDNFAFSGDHAKILPITARLTGLIENTDFTENILKVKNNNYMPSSFGENLYIFVTEAETTNKLSEQKIKGNLIYFPAPS